MTSLSAMASQRVGLLRGRLLIHTYTRTRKTAGAANDWSESTVTDGSVAVAPCYFIASGQTRTDTTGRVFVQEPTMMIGPSDVIQVGDTVSAITLNGTITESGPFTVQSINPSDGGGVLGYREAVLQRGDVL